MTTTIISVPHLIILLFIIALVIAAIVFLIVWAVRHFSSRNTTKPDEVKAFTRPGE